MLERVSGGRLTRRNRAASLRDVFRQSTDEGAIRARGCSLNPFKYRLDAATLDAATPDGTQIFLLRRGDAFAQTVLRILSNKTKIWPASAKAGKAERLRQLARDIEIDSAEFRLQFAATVSANAELHAMASALAGDDLQELSAEQLLVDSKSVLDGMFSQLGCPPPPASYTYPAREDKVYPEDLSSWLKNYDGLKAGVRDLEDQA